MTLPIEFSAEAGDELDHATSWYDEERQGIGSDVMDAIDAALETLAAWPHAGAPVDDVPADFEVRRAPLGRFPCHLGCLALDDRPRVIAVAHDHPRPGYWAHGGS